jgi:hypothetical protein
MDPDPDPSVFIIDLQDANKTFFCILLFEGTVLLHKDTGEYLAMEWRSGYR